MAGAVVPATPAVLAAGPFDGAPAGIAVARLVLLTGLALVAGAGLVRPVAGPPLRAERVVAAAAALAVAGPPRPGPAGPRGGSGWSPSPSRSRCCWAPAVR
ncbi:hypothetical protein GCM10009613_33640 [Pseudonocardia kongjuensis]|uniref:Uncharacterized protein n=1 Tax=Pseudonocardia kongjuensis TaxID=102227 RepID=A0ABN1Y0P7_9PSEU